MTTNERVIQAIFSALEEVNQQLLKEQRLEKSIDTVLLGESGHLDSVGLVTLIVATEEKIEEEFGVSITLTDKRALSQKESPFKTIGMLTNYIVLLLGEKA